MAMGGIYGYHIDACANQRFYPFDIFGQQLLPLHPRVNGQIHPYRRWGSF